MNNYKEAREFYNYILKNNGYKNMSMLWAISCMDDSLQAYDMDLITTDEEKEEIANLILSSWLDTDLNIGISKISDLIVENWQEIKKSDDPTGTIQDLIIDEVGF